MTQQCSSKARDSSYRSSSVRATSAGSPLLTRADASLRDFVSRILPLSTYFTAISSFIELHGPPEYGLVNHALCAALRDMLKVRRPYTPASL